MRFWARFICGSLNVSQIVSASPGAKMRSMFSISVRRKATLPNFSFKACVAPVHILAPFMSTPMKLRSEQFCASPTAYSPLPHPSSRVMGLELPKTSAFHFPRIGHSAFSRTWNGYSKTFGYACMSANFASLFFPIFIYA